MHMTIGAIVYAKSSAVVGLVAGEVFDRLVNLQAFDYYRIMEARKADSARGKAIIEQAMTYTRQHFLDNLAEVRKGLAEHTDEELFEDPDGMFKHYCYSAGRYTGAGVFLYYKDAEGIRDYDHLQNALTKWPGLKIDRDDAKLVWVVTADAHF